MGQPDEHTALDAYPTWLVSAAVKISPTTSRDRDCVVVESDYRRPKVERPSLIDPLGTTPREKPQQSKFGQPLYLRLDQAI